MFNGLNTATRNENVSCYKVVRDLHRMTDPGPVMDAIVFDCVPQSRRNAIHARGTVATPGKAENLAAKSVAANLLET